MIMAGPSRNGGAGSEGNSRGASERCNGRKERRPSGGLLPRTSRFASPERKFSTNALCTLGLRRIGRAIPTTAAVYARVAPMRVRRVAGDAHESETSILYLRERGAKIAGSFPDRESGNRYRLAVIYAFCTSLLESDVSRDAQNRSTNDREKRII